MAEIATTQRKRKYSDEEPIIIQLSDEDSCHTIPSQPTDCSTTDNTAKLARIEATQSQSKVSNLESDQLQNEVIIISQDYADSGISTLENLDPEIIGLKSQSDDLETVCMCKNTTLTIQAPSIDQAQEPAIKIVFKDLATSKIYKTQLAEFLKQFVELETHETETTLKVFCDTSIDSKEWCVINNDDVKPLKNALSKRKRKNRNRKLAEQELNDLFVVDTTPSINTKGTDFKYESKFGILDNSTNKDDDKAEIVKSAAVAECFNCNKNHNLRDCPFPKDFRKINAARNKFRTYQTKSQRYHLEDDQKFGHLAPGKVSEKLRRALGLHKNELPHYIYKMRLMGYPPGWLKEAQFVASDLALFDFDGKHVANSQKKKQGVDPNKVVEYPGFNIPMEQGIKDEFKSFGCPPYSNASSKESLLKVYNGKQVQKKFNDDLQACDMDIESSDKEAEVLLPGCEVNRNKKHEDATLSLIQLESRKQELLAQLDDSSNTNNSNIMEVTHQNSIQEIDEQKYKVIDVTDIDKNIIVVDNNTLGSDESVIVDITSVDEIIEVDTIGNEDIIVDDTPGADEIAGDTSENSICIVDSDSALSPAVELIKAVKSSSFGTPILKSGSPYSRLPKPDNFSQNISQVINFENLPNSTGKYEQMSGLILKVRKTLKYLNESQT